MSTRFIRGGLQGKMRGKLKAGRSPARGKYSPKKERRTNRQGGRHIGQGGGDREELGGRRKNVHRKRNNKKKGKEREGKSKINEDDLGGKIQKGKGCSSDSQRMAALKWGGKLGCRKPFRGIIEGRFPPKAGDVFM